MAWPSPTDYNEAVQRPRDFLEDEELRGGQVVRGPLGMPLLWSGNFADVYKIHCPASGNTWALKCFTRQVQGLQQRYRAISEHLEQAKLPFTVDFRYLERGISIGGQWYPALKMRWVEGLTLNQFVEEHLQRPQNLKMLLDLWVKLATRLREAQIAHADLQHGNVLLVPMEGGALALRLIDYDGMYVPALADSRSGELGLPAYQHPQRIREGIYSAEVDRFSHLVIYTAIRCLMAGPDGLWQRFNTGENLLFRDADFRCPEKSELFRTLWEMGNADAAALAGRLILACRQPLAETPLLRDLVAPDGKVQPLSASETGEVEVVMSAAEVVAAVEPNAEPPGVKAPAWLGDLSAAADDPSASATKGVDGPATSAAHVIPAVRHRRLSFSRALVVLAIVASLGLAAKFAFFPTSSQSPTQSESSQPLRFLQIAAQTTEREDPLTVSVAVENAERWNGLRFSLGAESPPGARIDPQTGRFTWTPSFLQKLGEYDVAVFVEEPNGQKDHTVLPIVVARPLHFGLIDSQTAETGKPLTVAVSSASAYDWKGKLRFSLGPGTPLGVKIDAQTGILTWTPGESQEPGKYDFAVSVEGPEGQKRNVPIEIAVVRPLRLRPVKPQAIEAGKPLTVGVPPDYADYWKGRLTYRLGGDPLPGATVVPQTGIFTWTPDKSQQPGGYEVVVVAETPDGHNAQASFTIKVLRPPLLKEITFDLGKDVRLAMILIPAGEFLMGSPDSEKDAFPGEKPQHRVRITKPFYLGKYLVTQEQWETVVVNSPSYPKNVSLFKGPKNPQEQVGWDDCQQFLEKLNTKIGMQDGKFVLPTEAQWEYACRAGSTTRYCFGDNEEALGEYAWYSANSGHKTHPVGGKKPNAWGLYDMHGNVYEWCQDWYDNGYYEKSATDDPVGPATGSGRVARGGPYRDPAGCCRSADRYDGGPGGRGCILGLRVSRVLADIVGRDEVVPRPQPFRLQPIAPQTIEAGKTLNVTATVENAEAWKGKLRYSLGPNAPVGLTIGSETGVLAWTPAEAQKPGKYDVTVSVEAPDGQRDKTVFAVTVSPRTAPTVAEDKEIFVDLDNGVKLEMVLIPAGEFMMGSPDSDKTAGNDEKPQHRVRITRPFYLGKYLVTQEQWEAVMGNNPSNFEGRKNPVEQVSWDDCQQFLGKLNERFHRPHPSPLPEGEGEFRLPTEAQWEYACRAGSTAKFCYGDSEAGLSEYAWYGANSGGKTHPVGEKKPNAWGLYDMHGNVWESCQDWYDDGYDGKSATDDPVGPATGSSRVDRGGGWDYVARYCRSARRYSYWPGLRSDHLGLRVSRVLADK